jgi:hypothetical protein
MTDPSAPAPHAAPASAEEELPAWWLLLRVLDEPGAVFRSVAQRPRALLPVVALVVVSFIAGFLTPAEQLQDQARQQVELVERRAEGVPPEQAEQVEARVQEMIANAASPGRRLTIAIFGAVIPLVGLAVVAVVLMLVFGAMGSEPLRFKQEFTVAAHAFVPQLLGFLVIVLLSIAGLKDVQLSLGFLSDMERSPFLFTLLSQFSLFAAWNVLLLAVGNQVLIGGKGLAGPLGIVAGLWIVKNVAVAGLVGLATGMMG